MTWFPVVLILIHFSFSTPPTHTSWARASHTVLIRTRYNAEHSGADQDDLLSSSQIHFPPCHILVLIFRTSSPLPNNCSHPAGPSIGSGCQHLKVIIPNLWHPGVYSYIMMGKTTCPQRQRTFLRCLPICFWGSCPFWAKVRMAGKQIFFVIFYIFSTTVTGQSGSHYMGW